MKKSTKLLLGLGTLTAVATPMAAVVSCGSEDGGSSLMLVTDGGSVDDQSFNQAALKAINSITGGDHYIQPASGTVADISSSFEDAVSSGAQTIVAMSYLGKGAIEDFLPKSEDTKFILVDDVVDNERVASVKFRTEQGGFLAGYAASKYLELINDTNPTVGTWGGGPFQGVTDFMAGFVEGVKYFNDNNDASATDVKFATLGSDEDYTNSGFDQGNGITKANHLLGEGADILLPVAGGQQHDAVDAIKQGGDKYSNVKVIGLDSDQANIYSDDADYYLTSILKDVTKGVVNAYNEAKYGETSWEDLDSNGISLTENHSNSNEASQAIAAAEESAVVEQAKHASNDWAAALSILKGMA